SSTTGQAENIIAHSGAAVLFVESAEKIKRLGEALSGVRLVVVIDGEAAAEAPESTPSVVSLAELERAGTALAAGSDRFEKTAAALGPDDDLTIIYTSGTTGEPKGVLTTHRHYLFMVEAAAAAIGCDENDSDMLFLPLAHSLGRVEHFF